MLLISYDIKNSKIRTKFSRMLQRNGAIRLQFSVYEVSNSSRILDNIKLKIEQEFSPLFNFDDSVVIFKVNDSDIIKYGNAIHRDEAIVYF